MKKVHFDSIVVVIKNEPMEYTGKEIEPLWAFEKYGLQKDSIVAFRGNLNVNIENMKDLKDVMEEGKHGTILIKSSDAMNFIIEHFDNPDLKMIYLRQRILISIAKDVLEGASGKKLIRRGDDLHYNEGKLSVSIACRGISSAKVHLGINLSNEGTPSYIKTSSLKDLEIDIDNKKILEIMEEIALGYGEEMDSIERDMRKTKCL
ncbi:DUF366 family protein [Methanothermococcus sp. SCGC AD-155-M21]|nr:DUF366 family protein [Methanothermococcus sp. SCGC AD-155-M21]